MKPSTTALSAQLAQGLRSVTESQTLLINQQSLLLEKERGVKVIKFGFGQSPFPPIARATEALQKHAFRKDYTNVQGVLELRESVAKFHQDFNGLGNLTADDVFVGPGSKALLLNILLSFTKANVYIPAPAWVSYSPQADIAGHPKIRVPCTFDDCWRVLPSVLDDLLANPVDPDAPKILILTYPGNPEGLVYNEDELRAIADSCRKHNCLVVSDEIYGELNHSGSHISTAKLLPHNTIVTTGLSKWCGAGGWRLGVALFPPGEMAALRTVFTGIASESYSCAPTPVQMAAIAAYQRDDITNRYLSIQRKFLSMVGRTISEMLNAHNIRTHPPQGAFYVLVDFEKFREAFKAKKGITGAAKVCEDLLQNTGVALLAGNAFGVDDEHHLVARLAYVTFDGAKVLDETPEAVATGAADYDLDWVRSHAPDVFEGIERICAYVDALNQ